MRFVYKPAGALHPALGKKKLTTTTIDHHIKFVSSFTPTELSSTMTTIALIKEAILALKDRTGSSLQAIKKWIETEKKVCFPECERLWRRQERAIIIIFE